MGERKVGEEKAGCIHICLLKSLSANVHWVLLCRIGGWKSVREA